MFGFFRRDGNPRSADLYLTNFVHATRHTRPRTAFERRPFPNSDRKASFSRREQCVSLSSRTIQPLQKASS